MQQTPDIAQLGGRICIIGPSNSGKSTLAESLAKKIGATTIHLDQMAHAPHTSWERRADKDFIADHDAAIASDLWVADGNYSVCMPQRFERATSVLWLDPPLIGCLYRYGKRSAQRRSRRPGALDGATSEFSWALVKHTTLQYPKNRAKYEVLLKGRNIPILRIKSMRELKALYARWGLSYERINSGHNPT